MNGLAISRKLLIYGLVVATSYAVIIGCGVEEGDDPDAGDTAVRDTNVPDTGNPIPDTGPSDMGTPRDVTTPRDTSTPGDTGGPTTYLYVRIEDTDGATTDPTEHVGPDIDAVSLNDGSTEVFAAAPTSTADDAAYPEGLAGPQTDPVCIQGAFLSIGTGPLIFQFEGGAAIEAGDTITVYEVDQIVCSPSGDDSDSFNVSVSAAADPAGTWTPVGTCDEGQACSLTVP